MLNKKAIAAGVLVGIIAMLVVFVVLFRLNTIIAGIVSGGAEDQICFLSAGISSFSRAGPKTLMDLQCPKRMVYVMMNSNDIPAADRQKDVEYVYIDKPIARKLRKNLAQWYQKDEPGITADDFKKEERVLKYRLNEVMAKELKKCWGNLGRGTYDLFDQDLLPVGTTRPDSGFITKILHLELTDAPKICHICAEIRFQEDVSNKFEEEIDLNQFLKNNPVKLATPEALSYYEFLEDDIKQSNLFGPDGPEYTYTTNQKQSIVFLRMNVNSYIEEVFAGVFEGILHLDLKQIVSDNDYKEDKDGDIRILAIDLPLIIPSDEISDNCDKFD